MKLFISADIEGTASIADWGETSPGNALYDGYFAKQMTKEVNAACKGALEGGVSEILIKDAHDTARNLIPSELPEKARILRGWTGLPCSMMAGLDSTFNAAAMTGYHTCGGSNGNPLAHTMNLDTEYIRINGELASEFMINAYFAAYRKVPVVFISGDEMICGLARQLCPHITAVPVSQGIGGASVALHPEEALRRIEEGMKQAVSGDLSRCLISLPSNFHVEVRYREHKKALFNSHFPGAELVDMKTVSFFSEDYMDVLKFFMFCL